MSWVKEVTTNTVGKSSSQPSGIKGMGRQEVDHTRVLVALPTNFVMTLVRGLISHVGLLNGKVVQGSPTTTTTRPPV